MAVSFFVLRVADFIAALLELFLASPRKFFTDGDAAGNHGSSSSSNNGGGDDDLQAAYNYFEITAPEQEVTRESIKKKYRKLCLIHHPDRNGNSEEAKLTFQRINNFYNIIIDELDRQEGVVHDDDDREDQDESESNNNNKPEQTEFSNPNAARSARKRGNRRRRRRRRQEREERELERHLRDVRERHRRQQSALRRQAAQVGLDSREGRARANREFWQQVEAARLQQEKDDTKGATATTTTTTTTTANGSDGNADTSPSLHDIDDEHDATTPEETATTTEPASSSQKSKKKKKKKKKKETNTEPEVDPFEDDSSAKPKNLVMEHSAHVVAVALRMGLEDAAIVSVQDGIHDFLFRTLAARCRGRSGKIEIGESDLDEAMADYLLQPLDGDGNAVLHYAAYYESMDLIRMVYEMTCDTGTVYDTFWQKNAHGRWSMPAAVAVAAVRIPRFPSECGP